MEQTKTKTKVKVQVVSAELKKDSHQLTGVDSGLMIGTVQFLDKEFDFKVTKGAKSFYSSDKSMDELIKDYEMPEFICIPVEDESYKKFTTYCVEIRNVNMDSLRMVGYEFDYSDLINKFKELYDLNQEKYEELERKMKTEEYNNSWFVKNLKRFNEMTVDGIKFEVCDSLEEYLSKSYPDLFFKITFTKKIKEKTIEKNYRLYKTTGSSSAWSSGRITKFRLEKEYDYLATYKNTDSIITKLNDEFSHFEAQAINMYEEEKERKKEENEVLNLLSNYKIETVKRTGKGGIEYIESYQIVNETKKRGGWNDPAQGQAIKFNYDKDTKRFSIIKISGNYNEVYEEWFMTLLNKRSKHKDNKSKNLLGNDFELDGFKDVLEFIFNKMKPNHLDWNWDLNS